MSHTDLKTRHYDQKFRLDKLRIQIESMRDYLTLQSSVATKIRMWRNAPPIYAAPPMEGNWTDQLSLPISWGKKQQWTYFSAEIQPLKHWNKDNVEIVFDIDEQYLERPHDDAFAAGPEGQVFIDGKRIAAIDREHRRIPFQCEPGSTYHLTAVFFDGRCEVSHRLKNLEVVEVDGDATHLYYDLFTTLDVVKQLPQESITRIRLVDAIDASATKLDFRADKHSSWFSKSVREAQVTFDAFLSEVPSIPEEQHDLVANILGVGHAHIDLAWLWPIKQTKHKCVRTFATQIHLLKKFPDWKFIQSSPQAYKWVESYAPDLFDEIREMVRSGRWEAEGAFWCESDTNIPNGESLVRQLLYGKKYFMEKFGGDSKILWLPDVFGYSANLPQLLRLAGVDYFVTSKISWSQFNRFPYDTFQWEGIDGSNVISHFITTPPHWGTDQTYYTYNSLLNAKEVKGCWDKYQQKSMTTEPLLTFGFGDGGGGPTMEMLEEATRLHKKLPVTTEFPRLRLGSVRESLDRLSSKAADLPKWIGELYLEYHRGTLTTQAGIKRANRKNEIALHNLEWLTAIAVMKGIFIRDEIWETLGRNWEDLLLMQFHDILPGSSVGEVYEETKPMHKRIADSCDTLMKELFFDVLGRPASSDRNATLLFNPLWFEREEHVVLEGGKETIVRIPSGGWLAVNNPHPAAAETSCEAVGSVPEEIIHVAPQQSVEAVTIAKDGMFVSNQFWEVSFDEDGCISRLYDRRLKKNLLKAGEKANEFQLFRDKPMMWDAWDIDSFYQDLRLPKPQCVDVQVVKATEMEAIIERTYLIDAPSKTSKIRQRVVIQQNSPLLGFETEIDWQVTHQLLKVAFPIDVLSREATYEIQFGQVKRPTHFNTQWDVARFEACAHRFVDVSERGWGVALLNDCKYGHDVHDSVIRLTLLKSPMAPNKDADKGIHQVRYALFPHKGDAEDAGVVRYAADWNNPIMKISYPVTDHFSPLSVFEPFSFVQGRDHVVLDTLKVHEDDRNTIVARFYEGTGTSGWAQIHFKEKLSAAHVVNLLEEGMDDPSSLFETDFERNTISFYMTPFKLLSISLQFSPTM
eukprot:TRINITY_DN504_c0_g1_i1.p1 TRINITY_DN504_c0_g1~~TRINITY_DN504_c0_g1_i1.p1  ORF type:complete len:1083 (+),score=271.77 TRINITY_DN504_c0_g1_i1:1065-4313(+)